MAILNSAEIHQKLVSAGVNYIPAEQSFYKKYAYKIEISPPFNDVGSSIGKRGIQIDVSDPVRGRVKINEFNIKLEKIFQNVEFRNEFKKYLLDNIPVNDYKSRLGGENLLVYLDNSDYLFMLYEIYASQIKSITGPINKSHQNIIDNKHVILRDKLYFGNFRYQLEFQFCEEFLSDAKKIQEILLSMPKTAWRASRLDICIGHYTQTRFPKMSQPLKSNSTISIYASGSVFGSATVSPTIQHDSIKLYLQNREDYVYFKLLAADYLINSHELILYDELNEV